MQRLKKVWSAVWRILVFVVAWGCLTGTVVVPVLRNFPQRGAVIPLSLRLYVEAVTLLAILLAAWLMVRFVDRRPFVSLGFGRKHSTGDSIIGLVIGLGMMAACVAILLGCGWATWNQTQSFSPSALTVATLAMLLNTFTQEILVRGYVQQTIQFRFGPVIGVIGSALFFLVLHLGAIRGQMVPAVSLCAAGVLLGTCYALTGKLWLPIALHFGWNVLQGPVLSAAVSGQAVDAGNHFLNIAGPELMTGGKFGIEGGLIGTVVTMLGTPLLILLFRNRIPRSRVQN